jgi:hypothetical protein
VVDGRREEESIISLYNIVGHFNLVVGIGWQKIEMFIGNR